MTFELVVTTHYLAPRPEGDVFAGRIVGRHTRLDRRHNREVEISNSRLIDLNISGQHETILLDPSQFEMTPPADLTRMRGLCQACQGYGLVEEHWPGEIHSTCRDCEGSGLRPGLPETPQSTG
jgi:hypothetical protein